MDFEVGQVFEGMYPPKAAEWCNENNAYIEPCEAGFVIKAVPAPTLEEARAKKLAELARAQNKAEKEAHVRSTLGFEIDANERAMRDITGLLVTTGEMDVVSFCDYNNVMHDVSYSQLKVMQSEIIQNAQYIYQQKWAMREAINATETVEDLDAIKISFKYLDIYEDVNIDDSETVEG